MGFRGGVEVAGVFWQLQKRLLFRETNETGRKGIKKGKGKGLSGVNLRLTKSRMGSKTEKQNGQHRGVDSEPIGVGRSSQKGGTGKGRV